MSAGSTLKPLSGTLRVEARAAGPDQGLLWGQLKTHDIYKFQEAGFDGGLRLDGSPEFVRWYEKRGLRRLGGAPMIYEGVSYTPMELPPEAARDLLRAWED